VREIFKWTKYGNQKVEFAISIYLSGYRRHICRIRCSNLKGINSATEYLQLFARSWTVFDLRNESRRDVCNCCNYNPVSYAQRRVAQTFQSRCVS
jgi:hypothetical protein